MKIKKLAIQQLQFTTVELESTSTLRTPKAQYNDTLALTMLFGWFEQRGKRFMDEIKPFDVQQLLLHLYNDGKAEATIKTYLRTISKVFTWLIDDMEVLDMRHPAKKVTAPKRNGLARERLFSDAEVRAILTAPYNPKKGHGAPIKDLIEFLTFTGCRVGEALHLEWPDVDFSTGMWHIHGKPKCPTADKMGWLPKWKKPRSIRLFPEALAVLERMPKHETFGVVNTRNAKREIISHKVVPGQFVFPKMCVSRKNGVRSVRYMRVDRIDQAWGTIIKNARVEDAQLKDLRTYCNFVLKSKYGFSGKEAAAYLGNSEQVNDDHYSPVSMQVIFEKMNQRSFAEAVGLDVG